MTADTLQESENLTFAETQAGQFAIGIVGLNNPRALNALTLSMFEAWIANCSNGRSGPKSLVSCSKPSGKGPFVPAAMSKPW